MIEVLCQGLLFDNDGVLISSIESAMRSWRRWAAHYGVPGAESVGIAHGTSAGSIQRSLRPGLPVEAEAEGLRRIEDMEVEDVADIEVLPGVRALLQALPAERWTVVTSATRRLFEARLRAAGLPLPARSVTIDDVVRGKPDPEPYRKGAALLGFAPADCIVVEDAPSGLRAGLAAGARVLGVLGTHSAAELASAGATWIVGGLDGLETRTGMDGLLLRFNPATP